MEINQKSANVYKAKLVKIHPLYVKNKRDQNDIALIETRKSFDFSDKEKVSPICLPSRYKQNIRPASICNRSN